MTLGYERTAIGVLLFPRFFEAISAQFIAANVVQGEELSIDSPGVDANLSKH